MTNPLPEIVSHAEWLKARKELLVKEKEWGRLRAEWAAERRQLPMEKVEKNYTFEGPNGSRTLEELFDGRKQLIIYHFMFDPNWNEGCAHCSFVADHFAGALPHLAATNTSFAVISRAPVTKIEPYKKRMGWDFPWLSSFGNDFNYDFQVTIDEAHPENNYRRAYHEPDMAGRGPTEGEAPGVSVFLRDKGHIYHTYSTYLRGLDIFINTFNFLDHTPLGRQEEKGTMVWVRRHDTYEKSA